MHKHRPFFDTNVPLLPPPPTQAKEWRYIFVFNWAIVVVFASFGATAIAFALKSIVDNSYTFGVFADCYQCANAVGAAPPANTTVAG